MPLRRPERVGSIHMDVHQRGGPHLSQLSDPRDSPLNATALIFQGVMTIALGSRLFNEPSQTDELAYKDISSALVSGPHVDVCNRRIRPFQAGGKHYFFFWLSVAILSVAILNVANMAG